MIRAVLAVALAAALVGAALPALEEGRHRRTEALLDAELADVRTAAASLADGDDATRPGLPGARRTVVVRIPERSTTDARVASVSIRGRTGDDGATLACRLAGGDPLRKSLDVPVRLPGGSIVLREPGTYRLALTLDRVGGRTVVTIRRADASGEAVASAPTDRKRIALRAAARRTVRST